MDTKDKLKSMTEKYHGVLRTSDVVDAKISMKSLAQYVKESGLEKFSQGIYCDPGTWTDTMFLLQLRCPRTVFSHETALFLHDLTDREPLSYTVTARTGYNPSHLTKVGIKVYTIKDELFETGLTVADTPFGNTVNVYNMERTICDVIRSRNTIEAQMLQEAMKQYVRKKEKNIHQLMEYAELFHVDRIISRYLEVLL